MIVNCILLFCLVYFCKDLFTKRFWQENVKQILDKGLAIKLVLLSILFIVFVTQFKLKYQNMVVVLIAYGLILIKSLVWYYAWNDDFNRQLNFNDFMIHLSLYFKEEQRLESSLKRCHEFTRTIQPIKRLMKDLDCSQDKTSMLLQFHSHYLWRTLVTIILNHEEYGDQNLDLRIESVTADILKLSQNVRSFQKDLFSFVKKLDIATGLSTILALLSKNMLNQTINLDSNSSYQTAMTLFLLSNLMILLLNHSVFKTKAVFKEECL